MAHAAGVGTMFAVGAALLVATVLPRTANAQMLLDRGPPQHRIVHRQLFAVRVNPLGLVYDGRFAYRFRLYESESPALRDNFIGVGVTPGASPAYVRGGPMLEIQPATVLGLWAGFEGMSYFGTFNSIESFSSAHGDNSPDEITRRGKLDKSDPLHPYAVGGSQLTFGANLQAKVSSIILRDTARFARVNLDLKNGHTVFYDATYDTMVPNGGVYLANDFDVLWRSDDAHILAGARYTATLNFYGNEHFLAGEKHEDPNASHRVGPLVAYTFSHRDGAAFNAPAVFLLAQWWAASRWRSGQSVSAAFPMIAVGFQFYGDLLPMPDVPPKAEPVPEAPTPTPSPAVDAKPAE